VTEEAFIRAVLDRPGEDTPRLVYADWLDDHAAPDRAAYLRAEAKWAALAATCLRQPEAELREAAGRLDPLWVARVSRPPLGACCDRLRWKASGEPLDPRHLDEIRRWPRVRLPADYAAFLLNHNGGSPLTADFGLTPRPVRWVPVGTFFPFEPGGDFRKVGTLNGEVDRYWKTRLPELLADRPRGLTADDVAWYHDFIPVANGGSERYAYAIGVYGEHRGRLQVIDWEYEPQPFYPELADQLGGSFAGLLALLSAPTTVPPDPTQA
jgi:uncharacterized protein (TIGR02996 family)